jgi:FAD/FMN-containing dehydrogenase
MLPATPRSPITNFGGNVTFTPAARYEPRTEQDVLDILDAHADGRIRVAGALHSWSDTVVSGDVLVDMRRFQDVRVETLPDGTVRATVEGGCRIKRLLHVLHARSRATVPALGLITAQSIAGAISTGTHGSGKSSLAHYIDEIRVAAYDPDTGKARVYVWNDGPELRAARCGLGCLGIVLTVSFRCLPKYSLSDRVERCASIDEVLAREAEYPRQQFFLIPHAWNWYVQMRQPVPLSPRRWSARLYRIYWFFGIDIGLHLLVKLTASVLRSPLAIRGLYRLFLPLTILRNRTFIDDSHRVLTMEHQLFRHLEIELFVPAAAEFVQQVLTLFDDARREVPETLAAELRLIGLLELLLAARGTFTFHYPVTFRKVLPDDTLISMTAGADEPYYAVSFITYVVPRDRFYVLAEFLARSMTALFGARLHWGKYIPPAAYDLADDYPAAEEFRTLCRRIDPRGVFRNEFVNRVLGFRSR